MSQINQISITGNQNIVLTDLQGSTIEIGVRDFLEQYAAQLTDILRLLEGQNDKAYIDLCQQIRDYQNAQTRSDLDAYNLYLERSASNQTANTSQPLIGKTVIDLDKKEVKRLFAKARVKQHFISYNVPKNTETAQKLRSLKLMTNGYVVKGTFFCLSHVSKLGSLGGNEDFSSFGVFSTLDKTVIKVSEQTYGNLIQQYEMLMDWIRKELAPLEIIDLVRGELDYSIPEIVFREVLANAFIHRTYTADTLHFLSVELYPDRIVIKNVGELPPNFNTENPQNIEPTSRNKEIGRVFFLHEFVEMKGSGIARIQAVLAKRGMRPAVFEQRDNMVVVTVYKKPK